MNCWTANNIWETETGVLADLPEHVQIGTNLLTKRSIFPTILEKKREYLGESGRVCEYRYTVDPLREMGRLPKEATVQIICSYHNWCTKYIQ